MKDTVNPKDIIQDVVHNFSSRYRGYAQYHNIQVCFVTTFVYHLNFFSSGSSQYPARE